MPNFRSHNDDPVDADNLLGRREFVTSVCEVIRQCSPPKAMAVTGYWGTGKTSVLRQIQIDLEPINAGGVTEVRDRGRDGRPIQTVWFDAWRYQQEGQPIVGLLHEIRAHFSRLAMLKEQSKKLTNVTIRGVLSSLDEVIKTISLGALQPKVSDLSTFGKEYESDRLHQALPTEDLRKLLDEAIKAFLDERGILTLLIDDLDRCEGIGILRLLEGIKMYLSLPRCVVVFAMDQRQIEDALSVAFAAEEKQQAGIGLPRGYTARDRAREYMEKICQDVYRVPLATHAQKSRLLVQLVDDLEIDRWASCRAELERALRTFDCLPANPRKIKVLANRLAFVLSSGTWTRASSPEPLAVNDPNATSLSRDVVLLLVVSIFYCYHRPVYEQLEKNPAFITDVIAWSLETGVKPEDTRYLPLRDVVRSRTESNELPVNPSDSHVFRLHQCLDTLSTVTMVELEALFASQEHR